jgi:hypothetical protein
MKNQVKSISASFEFLWTRKKGALSGSLHTEPAAKYTMIGNRSYGLNGDPESLNQGTGQLSGRDYTPRLAKIFELTS